LLGDLHADEIKLAGLQFPLISIPAAVPQSRNLSRKDLYSDFKLSCWLAQGCLWQARQQPGWRFGTIPPVPK